MNQPKCICPEIERTKHFVHLTDCPNYQPTSEDWERRLRKTGWFPHLETLGKRSLEEFLGCIQNFIDEALSTQKSKLIRDYDKKYNQLCEDKVREERERLIGEIRKWKRSGSVGGQYVNYSDALDDVLKLLEQRIKI